MKSTRSTQTTAKTPLMLTSLQQVKALAHPLRFRVFEQLTDSRFTGKQLAEVLGTPPTQLYHHLRLMEAAGLIREVETRKKRGTTEKYFEAVSTRVAIDDQLFAGRVDAASALRGEALRVAFDEVHQAEMLTQSTQDKPPVFVKRLRIQVSRESIEELNRTLNQWLESFAEASDEDGDARYAVTVAFYPTKVPDSW